MTDTLTQNELRLELAEAEARADALRRLIEAADDLGVTIQVMQKNGNGHGNGSAHPVPNHNGGAPATVVPIKEPYEPVEDAPRGRTAVGLLMADRPRWSIGEMSREMIRRRWALTNNFKRTSHTVGEALRRMEADGEVVRVRPGVYRLVQEATG